MPRADREEDAVMPAGGDRVLGRLRFPREVALAWQGEDELANLGVESAGLLVGGGVWERG